MFSIIGSTGRVSHCHFDPPKQTHDLRGSMPLSSRRPRTPSILVCPHPLVQNLPGTPRFLRSPLQKGEELSYIVTPKMLGGA
jgi:hypothetical protein